MTHNTIIEQIDAEIARLEQAKSVLKAVEPERHGHGVKPTSGSRALSQPKKRKKKRNLTPEGRARIVAAMKKRWAKQKTKSKSNAEKLATSS